MKSRPAIGHAVAVQFGPDVFFGTVAQWHVNPEVFWLQVELVNGKPKHSGSYHDPICCSTSEIIEFYKDQA